MKFKVGDYAKVIGENWVFLVCGITKEGKSKLTPAGWLMDKEGTFFNPALCEQYTGATSVLCD